MLVALSGALSGVFVVIANAWMNTPARLHAWSTASRVDVDPIAAHVERRPRSTQTLHMTLAAYVATGFAVAGIHACVLLRDRTNLFHRRALAIALLSAGVAAVLQPLCGDLSAQQVARHAAGQARGAWRAQFQTERGAPLRIGGLPDPEAERRRATRSRFPCGLSLLAFHDPNAEVHGLE